jgi:hypothetical protein
MFATLTATASKTANAGSSPDSVRAARVAFNSRTISFLSRTTSSWTVSCRSSRSCQRCLRAARASLSADWNSWLFNHSPIDEPRTTIDVDHSAYAPPPRRRQPTLRPHLRLRAQRYPTEGCSLRAPQPLAQVRCDEPLLCSLGQADKAERWTNMSGQRTNELPNPFGLSYTRVLTLHITKLCHGWPNLPLPDPAPPAASYPSPPRLEKSGLWGLAERSRAAIASAAAARLATSRCLAFPLAVLPRHVLRRGLPLRRLAVPRAGHRQVQP